MRPGRGQPTLSRRDLAVLGLEREWGQSPEMMASKLSQAKRDLDLSPGSYARVLNALIDDPAAMEYDPETITRLRAIRESRRSVL